jgi:hypothetical protein
VIGVLVLLPALLQVWWLTAPTRGQLTAHFDVWRGHYVIQSYGLNISGREYASLLKERYGIETHTVALCIVSETVRSYADSYNKVSSAAANRKFGHDVFKECGGEARQNWERERALKIAKE